MGTHTVTCPRKFDIDDDSKKGAFLSFTLHDRFKTLIRDLSVADLSQELNTVGPWR